MKHLQNIESLDFSFCNLTVCGAESVANLLKYQKIQRFSEVWMRSLRYKDTNAETIPGLKSIILNYNSQIGDNGISLLIEVLNEDVWIKNIEMQGCGITDEGANHIIKCLSINKTIVTFNLANNPDISNHLHRHINAVLGTEENFEKAPENLTSNQFK